MEDRKETVVILTTGKQDRGARATLAFSWACLALAMGMDTALFLTMDGTIWSVPGAMRGVQVDGFEPVERYFDEFRELGGRLLVCDPCAEYYCLTGSHAADAGPVELVAGAERVGLATVVALSKPGARVVTF